VAEADPIPVAIDRDLTEEWSITKEALVAHHSHRLTLEALDGRSWSAEASDVFECLMELRNQVEPLGVRLCCNGSRRNAWSSGMQSDMGQGLVVYLLSRPRSKERPPQVDTLGPAPSDEVVSVAEQQAWYESWLAHPPDGGA
jgi:hypothetical protein